VFTLANLTFQDVIRFYQSNNDAVYKDIKAAFLGGRLTPFIGAGLSVFCGYKLWPDVLIELSGFIPDETLKAEAQEMILENRYLEAAEHIHKHYKPMMRRLLGIVSHNKIDSCPDDRLYGSAVWVLPKLFGSRPMMTTNFDGILEYVFAKQNCAFERVVEPHDPSLLTQIRQKDTHGLFKLHGDIGRETTSIDRLVFTQRQYDEVYCEGGELISELKQWYQNQTLLFLGCSLAMDKTMEVLRDVVSKDAGIRHFAIVGCKAEQRSDFLERFGELGIDAIFYDDNNHDAVRVILENLLYETNQSAYQQLDDEMCRFVGPIRRADVLMYNAGRIKYVGRTEELATLERFCGSAPTNEWWAVTGPGGMGKSRLVYEFTNKKQNEGWEIRWFSRDQYDQLTAFHLPVEDTIVVLDDIQADTQTVGSWLKSMRQHRRRNRLRILLLERDGVDVDSADWLRLLRSGSPYSDSLAQWCHNHTFLHLTPLKNDDLKTIMTDCAETLGKKVDADALLTALIRVDKKLRRPLYALAVAEAACNGEDPIHWTSERVLDEMLDRELSFHYESLKYIMGTIPTRTQQQELENLLARCCVRSHLRVDEVTQEHYPYLTTCMEQMSPREFFRCLGLLQTEKEREILRMNCPDLIREHLVLRLALGQGRMDLLLPENWQEDVTQIGFLHHLLQNHEKRLSSISHLWEPVLDANPENSEACSEYADLLWSITVYSDNYCAAAVAQLERLFYANSTNSRIRTAYAAGIFNASVDLNLEGRMNSEHRLTELYKKYPGDRGIALGLAKSLRNLTFDQNIEGCTESIRRLIELSGERPDDRDFSIELAMGLCCLSFEQDLEGRAETVNRLAELSEAYPSDRDFALQLAIGLRSLSFEQDADGCAETVNRLAELSEAYPADRNFALQLAIGLRNLSFDQDIDGCAETVNRLAELSEAYSGDRDFALQLAIGLRNFSFDQDIDGCAETVNRLAELSEAYSGDRDFALQLAIGLRNLSFDQDINGCAETVNRLAEFSEAYSGDRDFALQLAMGLRILSYKQDLEGRTESTNRLTELAKAYPDDRDFALQLAMGLRILSFKQDLKGRTESANRLTELAEAYSGDRDFALQLAIGLRNLSFNQDADGCAETVNRLAELAKAYSGDRDFSLQLVIGMGHLTFVQGLDKCAETVNRMTELVEAYPGDRDFALELVKALRNQTYKQNVIVCTDLVQKITNVCNSFPHDKDFDAQMTSALVNLALAQTTEEAVRDTLVKSEAIRRAHPDHTDIQLSHAMTWFNLTLVQKDEDIPDTVVQIVAFLHEHSAAIPEFKKALDKYLAEHPDHAARYQVLLEL